MPVGAVGMVRAVQVAELAMVAIAAGAPQPVQESARRSVRLAECSLKIDAPQLKENPDIDTIAYFARDTASSVSLRRLQAIGNR